MNNNNIYSILKNFNKVAVEETAKPVEAKPKTQLAENMEQVLGKKLIAEKAANKYAVGMSQAMKSTGDKPPLKKSTIVKAHEIAKKVKEDRYKTIDDYLDAKRAREQEHGGEEEKKSNKRTVVGHYGKHYDPTDDDEEVVQKAKDTSGEKRGRGRPKGSVKAHTKADTANIKADKKKQVKGNVTKVKSGKNVKEGQYKTIEAMIKEAFGDEDEEGQSSYEQDQLRQAIGDEAFAQAQEFVNAGADPMALPDELYDVLYDHYQEEMPYGTQKARDGDPYEWISEKLMSVFGDETTGDETPMAEGAGSNSRVGGKPGEVAEWYAKNNDQISILNLLRHNAGLPMDAVLYFDDADLVYGSNTIVPNALISTKLTFNDLLTALVAYTNKYGITEGKKPDFLDMDKDGDKKEPMKKAVKDKEKEDDELAEMMRLSGVNVDEDKLAKKDYDKDGEIETGSEEHAGSVDKAIKKNQVTDEEKVDECMGSGMMSPVPGQAMEQEGKMNINTNMSSDGTKSVSISADGEAAVQLMQMLKLAGMGGQGPATSQAEPGVTVVSTEPEAEVDEEKDPRYQANTSPEEHVMPVQALTKGGNGDVAGKEKAMTPNGYQFGDNPRAMKESIQGLDNFGLDMMKEYESIKIKK